MLELKQISKRFGDKQILSDFNLLVPEKQIVAIVGPSGGGKTTLLRMLAGLETIVLRNVYHPKRCEHHTLDVYLLRIRLRMFHRYYTTYCLCHVVFLLPSHPYKGLRPSYCTNLRLSSVQKRRAVRKILAELVCYFSLFSSY